MRPERLTPRQRATLAAMTRGGMRGAAAELGISWQTVRNHARDAYRRLGVTSAAGAWRALGWLQVPEDRDDG